MRAVAASGVGERGGGERRRTGESFDIPVVEIFAFRDGKITHDDVYYKDASLVASAA